MRSNVKKLRIWAACLSLLFALTTLIGLLALPLRNVYAAGEANTADPTVLKFKQIAAGEDFAIALTYGGDLYAWSLLPKKDSSDNSINGGNVTGLNQNTQGTPQGATLGEYYPSTPIKLNVKFTGVVYNDNDVAKGVATVGRIDAEQYDVGTKDDTIKQIAATRTTAAFVTNTNLIYVWGKECEEPAQTTPSMRLLFREGSSANTTEYRVEGHNFIPAIIDYSKADSMIPSENNPNKIHDVIYLTASEYNYSAYCTTNENPRQEKNYIWGQSLYNQTGVNPLGRGASYDVQLQQLAGNPRFFLGDGNLYYVSGDKVYVRGKNFIVPKNEFATLTQFDVVYVVENGNAGDNPTTVSAGADISLKSAQSNAPNKYFEGWYLDAQYTRNMSDATEEDYKDIAGHTNKTITLYAKFADKTQLNIGEPAVNVTDKTISWTADPNAEQYVVSVANSSNTIYTAPQNAVSFDLQEYVKTSGVYTVTIVAEPVSSQFSSVEKEVAYTVLAAPELTLDSANKKITFAPVDSETSYQVTVTKESDGSVVSGISAILKSDNQYEIDLSSCTKADSYSITVAVDVTGKTNTFALSDTSLYTVESGGVPDSKESGAETEESHGDISEPIARASVRSVEEWKLQVPGVSYVVTGVEYPFIVDARTSPNEQASYIDAETYINTQNNTLILKNAVSNQVTETAGFFSLKNNIEGEWKPLSTEIPLSDSLGETKVNVTVPTLVAGNGYGYLLAENGNLYFWGDNRLGQSGGSYQTTIREFGRIGTGYSQIVSGKLRTGNQLIEKMGSAAVPVEKRQEKFDEIPDATHSAYKFNNSFVDGNTLISATLDSNGNITAFGALNGDVFRAEASAINALLAKYGVNTTSDHKIAVLFGGYDNNLFAISSLGKMFRFYAVNDNGTIKLECEAYNDFSDANGNVSDASKWETGAKAAVTFKTEYWTGTASDSTAVIGMDGQTVNGSHAEITGNGAVVSDSSRSGDVYRMIVPVGQNIVNYPATGLAENTAKPQGVFDSVSGQDTAGFKLWFYWDTLAPTDLTKVGKDGNHIPDEVVSRYFSIEYRYTAATPAIDFVITPKQSTAGKSITIFYWVGRYDTVKKFATPTFYDFKQTSVTVTIEDTLYAPNYTAQVDASDTNSSVPLLDPNNPFNRNFSIATMNVSAGFDAVLDKLGDIFGDANYKNKNKQTLLTNLEAADKGFPASTKIAKGSLRYYNKDVDKYYNNTYKFFVSDHDGDIVDIAEIASVRGYEQYFTYATDTVTVFLPFGVENDLFASKQAELLNWFTANGANNGGILRFDNKYGLTMRILDGANAENPYKANGIEFSYQVLRISAENGTSMDHNFVRYDNLLKADESATPVYDISSPITTATATTADRVNVLKVSVHKRNDSTSMNDLLGELDPENNRVERSVQVFTQSSLTFKPLAGEAVDTHKIYGAPASALESGKTNAYEEPVITLNLVSEGHDSATIDLSKYFNRTDYIRIAYDGETSDTAWKRLEDSFGSDSSNAIKLKVGSQGDSFSIEARREVSNYVFGVQVRRVYPGSTVETMTYGATLQTGGGVSGGEPAESIYLTFRVNVTFARNNLLSSATAVTSLGTINSNTTVPLILSPEEVSPYDARMSTTAYVLSRSDTAITVTSSNPSVLRARLNDSRTGIVVEPRSSGTAWVTYEVRLFGRDEYVFTDSFQFVVKTLSVIETPYRVIDSLRVYVSDLTNYIIRDNALGNATLALDDSEDSPAYWFEERTGEAGAEDEWTKIDGNNGIPSFLQRVGLSSEKDYFNLVMGTFDALDTPPDVRGVVKFKRTDNSSGATPEFYEIAFYVEPAARSLRDPDSKQPLTIQIDKAGAKIGILTESGELRTDTQLRRNSDGWYEMTVDFFANDKMLGSSFAEGTYEIVAVQSVSVDGVTDYSDYVEVETNHSSGATAIKLRPLYPTLQFVDGVETERPCNIQVAICRKSDGGDKDQVVLLNFDLQITGIKTVLDKDTYKTVILTVFFCVLGVLIIIFFIRMGIYWKKKADQRRIIKKNQTLIKMRDKMHNKTEAVSKEKLVRTKLKMEDPKYARMFNEMRQNKEAETGIALENSAVAKKADKKAKAQKAAKKKGKKSIEELQAELAAKREAVQRMQEGDFTDVPIPEGAPMDAMPDGVVEQAVPVFDPDMGFNGMSAEQLEEQFKQAMSESGVDTDGIVLEAVPDSNENGDRE